jgi:hypothetical protein
MDTHPGWRTPLSALAVFAVACGTQDRLPTETSSRNTLANVQQSELHGAVLGPDGRNICRTVTDDDSIFVDAIPQSFELPFPPGVLLDCPANRFAFQVDPGEYRLRAIFTNYSHLGDLPASWILPPVTVGNSDVTRNIRFDEGRALGGRATIDGDPFQGLVVVPIHEFFFGFGIGGLSDRNGRWDDAAPLPPFTPQIFRSPFILQKNVEYFVVGPCDFTLGTVVVSTSFFQPFVFPSDRSGVDCELETGPARRFTHTRNEIAVTAFPGDIGGVTGNFGPRDPNLGTGFGVQFPHRPGRLPPHGDVTISQLFTGGLMIGIGPETVLTGIDNDGGYMECRFDLENGCRDLGLDARGEVNRLANGGRVITWRYSDAPSGEGVGLRINQRSFDAPQGENYVLFRFTIRNGSNGRLNVNPGIFTDFDVDSLFEDEVGRKQRSGRLISQADADDPDGTRVGTLMVGESEPAPGFFVHGGPDFDFPSIADQIAALRGNRTNSASTPDDQRYIQSVRTIGLAPGAETNLWVAVIAAASDAAFAEAADAAAGDIAERRQRLLAGAPEVLGELEYSYSSPAIARTAAATTAPRCGKDCMLKLTDRRYPVGAGSRLSAGLQHQRGLRE